MVTGGLALVPAALPNVSPADLRKALDMTAARRPGDVGHASSHGSQHYHRAFRYLKTRVEGRRVDAGEAEKLINSAVAAAGWHADRPIEQWLAVVPVADAQISNLVERVNTAAQLAPWAGQIAAVQALVALRRGDAAALTTEREAIRLCWDDGRSHWVLAVVLRALGFPQSADLEVSISQALGDDRLHGAFRELQRGLAEVPGR